MESRAVNNPFQDSKILQKEHTNLDAFAVICLEILNPLSSVLPIYPSSYRDR